MESYLLTERHYPHNPLSLLGFPRMTGIAPWGRAAGAGGCRQGCTHPRRPRARCALPSWAAFCPRGRRRSPARCGSAAAAGTPRGRQRLRRAGASWGSNTHTAWAKEGQHPHLPKNLRVQQILFACLSNSSCYHKKIGVVAAEVS